MGKTYKDGIKAGRKQIIKNILKYYKEFYWYPPKGYMDGELSIPLPSSTLRKYFKEIEANFND